MNAKLYTMLSVTLLILVSCTNQDIPKPLAQVYDKYLYPLEVDKRMFNNTTKEDSALIMKTYIEKWIQNQLLLKLAEKNLSESEKNVSKELENYRASLLIFKFEQAYINQKMDTLFTNMDLQQYYEHNKQYFTLEEPIVKALYIKLRKEAPQIKKIKTLYTSEKEEDIKELDNLSYQAAVKYDYFNDSWIALNLILQQLPSGNNDIMSKIQPKTGIELEDDEHIYLVYFKDIMKRNEIAPYEYATERIKDIMLNTRRNNLIRDLERSIVAHERDNGHIQIFDN